MNKNLGKLIKEIRSKNKLSQKRFGYKLGLSGKTISAYETGRITPTYKILERIADVYNTNIITQTSHQNNSLEVKLIEVEEKLQEIKKLLNFDQEINA